MRFICLIAIAFFTLSLAHWTQRWEHATVFVRSGFCPSDHTHMEGVEGCVYHDATLDTDTLTRQYVLKIGDGSEVYLQDDQVSTFAFTSGQNTFTWRTYLVFLISISLTVWLFLTDPDMAALGKALRRFGDARAVTK